VTTSITTEITTIRDATSILARVSISICGNSNRLKFSGSRAQDSGVAYSPVLRARVGAEDTSHPEAPAADLRGSARNMGIARTGQASGHKSPERGTNARRRKLEKKK
jgi:hypothetical protein